MDESFVPQLIQTCLDFYSPDTAIQTDAENRISQLKSSPLDFLIGVINLIEYPNVPIEAVRMSLIITKQLLHDEGEKLQKSAQFSELLKSIISLVFSSTDQVIQNLTADIYVYFFNIERENSMEALEILFSNLNQSEDPNQKAYFLNIINEILNLQILQTEAAQPLNELFENSILIIASQQDNENVTIELRISAAQFIIKYFTRLYFVPKDDYQLICAKLLEALPNSFQIDNPELFFNVTQIMKNIITCRYEHIEPFIETIVQYSFNSFSIENSNYWEIAFEFWRQIATFENKEILHHKGIKDFITQNITPNLLPFCQNAINKSNLDNYFDSESPDYSIITASLKTIRTFYKIVPDIVSSLIIENFDSIIESNPTLFTAVSFFNCLITKIYYEDPYPNQFLQFAAEKSELLFALANDQNAHIATRVLSLKTLGKLLKTFKFYGNTSIIVDSGHQISLYFDLICNEYAIADKTTILRPGEHPFVVEAFIDLILKMADARKNLLITTKQHIFFDENLPRLTAYLFALFESNYTNFNQSIVECSTRALKSLISIANLKNQAVQDFLIGFFDYCEKHLSASNSLFESPEVRFTFQHSLCELIGALGGKMAIDNEICRKSFESLLQFVKDPNQLVFEEAMLAISQFIRQIATLIDPEIIKKLYLMAMGTLTIPSEQKILSASMLIQSLLEKNFIEFLVDDKQQVVFNIYNALQTSFLDNPTFTNCHCFIFSAIASLFEYVDNALLLPLRDELWNLLNSTVSIIDQNPFDSDDDLEDDNFTNAFVIGYLNAFYQVWCNCLMQFVRVFIDLSIEGSNILLKNVLDLMNQLGYKLKELKYKNINTGLYMMYICLIETITSKCTKQYNSKLNKSIIKQPLRAAISIFQDERSKRRAKIAINNMENL